jgi:alkylation response protein AidB-like acyl-CoA dehydrogenase
MKFLLHEVFQAESFLSSMEGTEELSAELVDAILEEAAKIADDLVAPINHSGDQTGCKLVDGSVKTPEGFKEAFSTFAQGGWASFTGNPEYGGQGMPKILSVLFEEMLFAANSSFALYTALTSGATLALSLHGSEELKQKYLPNLYSGRWTGTMCLTESHAGTDLGIMKTKAIPQADGAYKISGTKIFITAGDHDLTENIIHFVLAKLPDAPVGAHGISLFIVPKFVIDEQGESGTNNGVSCGSLEHKMGIKASATCVMNFDDATGYLVGEENKGLVCMFTMMNYERLNMGLQGIGLADSSYQVARDYALDRIQGRSPTGPVAPEKSADPIIVHPDVRRMLLTMRANIIAGRALNLYTASKLDTAKFGTDPDARATAAMLAELLTPISKAYCTDRGFDGCVMGQQVLGGHGYINEWGQEQNVRDARIAQIYEGTNGIQALDLMGRKTVKNGAEYLAVLINEIDDFVRENQNSEHLRSPLAKLQELKTAVDEVTSVIISRGKADATEIGAASYAYMDLMGLLVFTYMWNRVLLAASNCESGKYSADYLDGLGKTAHFFFERLLPQHKSLIEEIEAGSQSLMAMSAEQF